MNSYPTALLLCVNKNKVSLGDCHGYCCSGRRHSDRMCRNAELLLENSLGTAEFASVGGVCLSCASSRRTLHTKTAHIPGSGRPQSYFHILRTSFLLSSPHILNINES